jgi:hypothetical protein
MDAKKIVAESLLTGAWDSGMQPVGVRHGAGFDDMNRTRRRNDQRRGHHVRDRVERSETLVDGHLEDRGRRVEGAVDGADALAVPAAAIAECAFAAVPGGCVDAEVETPDHQLGAAERRRQRRHV